MSKINDAIYKRYEVPKKVTVLVDTREKYPMIFPDVVHVAHPFLNYSSLAIQVETKKQKLDVGDYMLGEYPDVCIIERKASQLELYKNLMESRDSIRQAKAFRKLAATAEYPVLLVEASPTELLRKRTKKPWIKNPEIIVSKLSLAVAKYGFNVVFIPWKARNYQTRRKVWTLLVHMMVAYAVYPHFEVVPNPL